MKRLVACLLLLVQLSAFTSCKSEVLLKKNPPPIPSQMRMHTVITVNGEKTEAVTDFNRDGIAEFMLTDHENLGGLVFRSEPSAFKILADGLEVQIEEASIIGKSLFYEIGRALRVMQKTYTEPIAKENLYEYDFTDFLMCQDADSGEIVSIRFKETSMNVDFMSIS